MLLQNSVAKRLKTNLIELMKEKYAMKRFLITGATGNIGFEVIRFLTENNSSNKVIVGGVRDIEKAKKNFSKTFQLWNSDSLILKTPTHLSNL